jgi:FkbM family methyltransferase
VIERKEFFVHNFYQHIGEILYNNIVKYFSGKSYIAPPHSPVHIKLKRRLINLILKFDDPIVNIHFGKTKLKMRLSQENPWYHAICPIFSAQPRIAAKINNIESDGLFMVEVGSNIGDTASLIAEDIPEAHILCIEGENSFLQFLEINLNKYNNIYIEPSLCVDKSNNNRFRMNILNGTAIMIKDDTSKLVNVDTLDNIIERYSSFHRVNFLKVDASGSEIRILRGANNTLSKKPLLYIHFAPELYIKNRESPMDLMEILYSCGYTKILFYTNFGWPVGIFNSNDKYKIQELIDKVDNKNIFYYSLLTVPNDKYNIYSTFIDSELNFYRKA